MKGIVLIIFIGFMIYEALSLMQIIAPTIDEAERVGRTKNSLSQKILVPEGMETEYSLIFNQNMNPITKTHIGAKSRRRSAKDTAKQHKVKTTSAKTREIKTRPSSVGKDLHVLVKLENYIVQRDKLRGDLILYNKTTSKQKGIAYVECTLKAADGAPVDVAKWRGRINLKPGKAIKLKDANLGYINAINAESISCKVTSVRYK